MHGPCNLTTQHAAGGANTASVQCADGGAVTIVAPAPSIEALGIAASGAAP